MAKSLRGVVRVWGLTEQKREYITVELPYGQARTVFRPDPYFALTGKGEQRGLIINWARTLRKEMEAGTFTPTPVSAGVRPEQARGIQYEAGDGGQRVALITVEENDHLPLTDGGHRINGLAQIREDAEQRLRQAKGGPEREAAQAYLDLVDRQPITAVIHLNGDTQDDFVNLQKGKTVDPSHLLSLRIQRELTGEKDGPSLCLAWNVARLLNARQDSPFFKQIRFDSKGMAPLPVSTLCSKGSSDIGTSLTGMARVGLSADKSMRAEWLASAVVDAHNALKDQAPDLLAEEKVLTPPPDGTKGAATMLIGLGVALAYRMLMLGHDLPSPDDLARLVAAAREALDHSVNGNFSGPAKRKLLGEFARAFLADLALDRHDGLPVDLLKILSPSAFGALPLPKTPSFTGAKKAAAQGSPTSSPEGETRELSTEAGHPPAADADSDVDEYRMAHCVEETPAGGEPGSLRDRQETGEGARPQNAPPQRDEPGPVPAPADGRCDREPEGRAERHGEGTDVDGELLSFIMALEKAGVRAGNSRVENHPGLARLGFANARDARMFLDALKPDPGERAISFYVSIRFGRADMPLILQRIRRAPRSGDQRLSHRRPACAESQGYSDCRAVTVPSISSAAR